MTPPPPRNNQALLLLLCISLSCLVPVAFAFAPPPPSLFMTTTTTTTTTSSTKNQNTVAMFQSPPRGTKDTNYNDDAFGFIFLGGSAAAQDPVFGAVFLTLSAAAAIGTKLQRLPPTNQVPAAVAGCTLLVVPLLSAVLPETLLSAVLPETIPVVVAPNARYIELAFCSVSMLYGFVISPTLEENES